MLSLEQQLLASMQQHAGAPTNASSGVPASAADGANPAAAHLYQQLLAHQMQQQQGSQPPSLPTSPPTNGAAPSNDLIQQLASSLLNPNLAALQPQVAAQSSAQASAFAASSSNLAALTSMMATSPQLLPSLLNGGGQPLGQANPLAQLLLNQNAAQSHAASQQQNAAAVQQQLLQRLLATNGAAGGSGNLLALLQVLQSGNGGDMGAANPQLYQQLLAQQMQQQQAAQQSAVNPNLALLQQLMGANGSTAASRLSNMTDMNQLAALLQQSQIPSQGDQTPKNAYDEFLRQQQQEQHQQALAAAVAAAQQSQTHHLPGRLSAQNSSNSLLTGLSASGFDSPTSSAHPAHSAMSVDSPLASASMGHPAGVQQAANGGAGPSASRQASSERLLNSAESVQDHISRLISENEAIVEPNPVLLKRRPYHRQSTSNSITSQTSDMASCSSQRGSPGLFHQVPNHRLPTTRSQSMHESQMLSSMHRMNAAGSLTSGQPVVRNPYGQPTQQPPAGASFTCNYCNLKFPNDAGLKAHESRCSKREQLTKHQSQPQLQWPNSALLNAQQQQQQLLLLQQQQQQKLLAQQQHQSNIAALVGGGAGVAPDPVINGGCSGRSSVPIGAGTGARCNSMHQFVAAAAAVNSPPPQASKNGTSSPSTSSTGSENRHPLKKRLLESVRHSDANSAACSPTSVTPTASAASSIPNIDMHEAQNSPAKIAKLGDFESSRLAADHTARLPPSAAGGSGGEGEEEVEDGRLDAADLISALRQAQERQSTGQPAQMSAQQEHQLLFAQQLSTGCPKVMRSAILYCASYIEAQIADKMPYVLTLDESIAEVYRKHHAFSTPALLSKGRPRNVTLEMNTTRRPLPSCRLMSGGQSAYAAHKPQTVINVEDEMHLLLSLRNSARPIKFLDYTTPADSLRNRTTHSEYWTADAKPEVDEEEEAEEEADEKHEEEEEDDGDNEEEAEEEEEEVENKPDRRLTEVVTAKPRISQIGGKQHEEVEVYVRGRGRGRYICERCGIRCKKPSMLKKHLKSHTNERPHICITCNFAFKTRGNLTKHFGSKGHRSKVASSFESQKRDGEEGDLRIATPEDEAENRCFKLSEMESKFINDQLDDESDNDDEPVAHPVCSDALSYHKFGQENILVERETHTPPTLWMLCDPESRVFHWPKANENRPLVRCHSAPPAALCSPIPGRRRPLFKQNDDAYRFGDASPAPADEDVQEATNLTASSSNSGAANYVLPANRAATAVGATFDSSTGPPTPSTSGLNEFLAGETSEFSCDLCPRKFRKSSDLHLHQQTHRIEQQQNARGRNFACPECGVVHRSRALLDRHVELVHSDTTSANDQASAAVVAESPLTTSASATIAAPAGEGERAAQPTAPPSTASKPTIPLAGNVRKYWCNDCNIGFRTNGVLAKHLRSKNHAKNLTAQGKLPSDTMALIAAHASHLNEIDAADCETARNSLISGYSACFSLIIRPFVEEILEQLRGKPAADQPPAKPAEGSLECAEQMDAPSPDPPANPKADEPPIGISHRLQLPPESPLPPPTGHKRKHTSERRTGSPSPQRPRSGSCTIGISAIGQKRLMNSPSEVLWRHAGSQSGPATPRLHPHMPVNRGIFGAQSPVVANMCWMPPRLDQLDADRLEATPSNRSAEEMSESTGRSESSTPVQRCSIGATGGQTPSGGLTNGAASPIPTATKCQLCDVNFESPPELQVHMFADHTTMRDGKDFRCPRRNCDKIYPNRVSLRAHLHAHFFGGGATPTVDGRDELGGFGTSPSPDPPPSHRNARAANSNGLVPNHSPGAPEATQTVAAAPSAVESKPPTEQNGAHVVSAQSSGRIDALVQNEVETPNRIACNMCGATFVDAGALQTHWIHDHLSQLNARPHVCPNCDAAFTTAEALQAHAEHHR
ncbi:Transcription factor HIVEP3 [Aphelenchoides fujianensis]|nr:Transcription factor HIVEP3 [Aphelenchoides fujianensis]